MTPEEQRIAIAEACGWRRETRRKWAGAYGVPGWGKNKHLRLGDRNRYFTTSSSYFPDYLNNLNAMAEAEEALSHDQWRIYLGFIMGQRVIPKFVSMEEFHRAWCATSAKRAEAFLKTVVRWKE